MSAKQSFPDARIAPHALEQMQKRCLARDVVRAVLAQPQVVVDGDKPLRYVCRSVIEHDDPPRRVLLRAVVDAGASPPRIVTVYLTPDLRRYGLHDEACL